VAFWLTTADQAQRLAAQADLRFTSPAPQAAVTIEVDPATIFQEIDGFGAALTDSAAHVLSSGLDAATRQELMRRLFDAEQGIGLTLLRQPMGASDFARSHYTYDDSPDGQPDPALTHFSIDHDREEIIPLLKQARELQPRLRLMATPWSAPAWMKTSGSLVGGRLRSDYAGAYASYFVRFAQAYADEGLPIDFVTVQNEPHHEPPDYPGMRMDAGEQAAFIRDHLGPAFAAQGLSTRILVWDHNWDEPEYPIAVLDDTGARTYAAGAAFHCYAGSPTAQARVAAAHPDRGIWFTECSGGDWSPDYGANLRWNARTLVVAALRNEARSLLLWNLALDATGGPHTGGCSGCRGVVTVDGGTYRLEVEYDILGHLAKFVFPGAHRVASTQVEGRIETVAFRNADGSTALVAFNASATSESVAVSIGEQAFSATLPAGALATFVW